MLRDNIYQVGLLLVPDNNIGKAGLCHLLMGYFGITACSYYQCLRVVPSGLSDQLARFPICYMRDGACVQHIHIRYRIEINDAIARFVELSGQLG